MLKQREPIQTKSYVYVDGKPVELCTLPVDVRARVAAELKVKMLNAFFAGEAEFSIDEAAFAAAYPGWKGSRQ